MIILYYYVFVGKFLLIQENISTLYSAYSVHNITYTNIIKVMFFIKAVQCHTVLRVINNNAPKSIKPCCTSKWNFINVIGNTKFSDTYHRNGCISTDTNLHIQCVCAAVIQHS